MRLAGVEIYPAVLSAAAIPGRRTYRARFVRAGRIRAAGDRPGNLVIEAGALLKNVRRFENKAVFVDHAGWFQIPSLHNLVGVTHNVVYNEATQSIDGEITFYRQAENIGKLLDDILADESRAPDVGMSIVFWPVFAPEPTSSVDAGEQLRKIVDIMHVESVDLVFEPAADGRILEALSAHAKRVDDLKTEVEMVDELVVENEKIKAWTQATTRLATASMLAASGLPAISRERLVEGLYDNPDDVQAAIEAERAYLAQLAADNVIQVGGQAPRGGHIQVGLNGLEQLRLAAEAMLEGRRPAGNVAPLSGIRELYMLLSGDYELTGRFNPERIQFANVDSSSMANMVADLLNKRVVNLFQEYPRWWEPVCSMEDYASLQSVKWITLGGVGELPTVAEGAAYTEMTWDDQRETASFVKKGGYLGITLEAIDKDDTRRLQAAPRALAQAAWLTLSKSISGIFTDNSGVGPTMSDSVALFHANHSNLGSTALSLTTYAAARTAMRKQTELNSAERLGALTAPKYLLVPPDLEITALQVLASQFDYTYALSDGTAAPENIFSEGNEREARLTSARNRVIVVDLWTDTNNWAAVADPRLWPTIGLAFRYGRTPEIFSVASPTAGLMFTNDTMPVKVRYFYATGPMDYRGLYKANVA